MNKKIITATLLISDGPVDHSYFSELLDITNDELIKDLTKQIVSLGGKPTLDQTDQKLLIKI